MANIPQILNPVLWFRSLSLLLRDIRDSQRVEGEDELISRLIKEHAPTIKDLPQTLDAEALLWALYHCERYDPNNKVPRFEPAYAPGGRYYASNQQVRINYASYGREAACSYSNFQILYATARELGYTGPPAALDSDSIALPYVCEYIHRRIFDKGATTPEQVADAYNSGSYQDSNKPEKYIAKFRRYYDKAVERQWKALIKKPEGSSTGPTTSPSG